MKLNSMNRLPENEIAILEKAYLEDFGKPLPEHLKYEYQK